MLCTTEDEVVQAINDGVTEEIFAWNVPLKDRYDVLWSAVRVNLIELSVQGSNTSGRGLENELCFENSLHPRLQLLRSKFLAATNHLIQILNSTSYKLVFDQHSSILQTTQPETIE